MKRQLQKGFTLIELMIVVAIIGILAAVALPAYQDYTKRARITEGFNLSAAAKTGVADFFASNNILPSDNASIGLPTSTAISGASVTSVGVAGSGVITITYNTRVSDAATTIILTPSAGAGAIAWSCSTGTVDLKLRPANCRS